MSGAPEYIQKFIRFLRDASWHRSILNLITDFLENQHYSLSEIDSLIMSVTKKVETSLRDAVARYQGSSVPSNSSYGVRLLDYAVRCGLIRSKKEPVYALLYWIFKEPRNTSHHEFVSYPYNTLVLFMSEANEAIERIENLIGPSYRSRFRMFYDEEKRKIKVEDVTVWRPNGTPLPADQKVEISMIFPDKTIKTIPLNYNEKHWKGEYDARGIPCGTISGYVKGVDHGRHFVAPSGSTAVAYFPHGESCPNCGNVITSDNSICPNCGKRLLVV